jgi:hypothetical protein
MLKQGIVASFVLVSVAALAAGCSSDEDGDGGLENGGSNSGANGGAGAVINTTGGTSPIPTGGTSSGGTNGTVYDGGTTEIDDATYDGIVNSACAAQQQELEAIPGVLELVIDVSSSMNQQAPGSNQTKWEATRDALLNAVDALPASISVGMLFYPNLSIDDPTSEPKDVTACVNVDEMVPIALLGADGAQQRSLISEGIANVQLQQSTPTHDAYTYALDEGMVASRLTGDRFMLLITDGAPTLEKGCLNEANRLQEVDADPIVDEVTRAAGLGIRTFLIGSPGSEPNREWMSRAAVIGGTALDGCQEDGPNYCHMDMTTAPNFSQALVNGLAAIAGIVSPCSFEIPTSSTEGTIDPATTNVIVTQGSTHTSVGRDDIGDCTEGFKVEDNIVTLCPDTCSYVQADPTNRVEVVFGCDTLPPPVK